MGTGDTSNLLYLTYERLEWPVLLWTLVGDLRRD